MARLQYVIPSLLIPASILLHLYVSPYTKVEESFNMQATHDILFHGVSFSNPPPDVFLAANYDHVSFPGAVPRTFVGAVVLSGLARPFLWLGVVGSWNGVQVLVRAILGLLNGIALIAFGRSVARSFGTGAGVWYALFQASQFHVMYYASRTLPNMFAFFLSTTALTSLLATHATPWTPRSSYKPPLYLLTFAGIVFRSELALLLATLTLHLLLTRRISLLGTILPAGLAGALTGLSTTVGIDSFFWQTFPLWPEWTGFVYNTVQGHSADWGVSPWHFYLGSALPRLLLNPATYALCIPAALLHAATRPRSLDLALPALAFVALYSALPHKEWRFIVYVVPALTAVAAAGASYIWTRRGKSVAYALLSLVLAGSVVASFAASTALLAVSSLNYPGGAALDHLHAAHDAALVHDGAGAAVYLDNLACQTGATRFLESHRGAETVRDVLDTAAPPRTWTYDKSEDPAKRLDPLFWRGFDFALVERPETVIGKWDVGFVAYGFGGVRVLRPGQESGGALRRGEEGSVAKAEASWTDRAAETWKGLERSLRQRVLRGWWVELRMEPKIYVLTKSAQIGR